MAKVGIENYIWLIERLARRPMTWAELADSYERSMLYEVGKPLQQRTLYNWRQKIFDLFNIRIEIDGDKYTIADKVEAEQNHALKWLMQSMAVNDMLAESRMLRKRVLLEDIPSGEQCLMPILKAMKSGHRIKFDYHRFGYPDTHIVAEPFCVKVNNRRWYMLCRIPGADAHHRDYPEYDRFGCLRIYALDRMEDLRIIDETFEYPRDFDAEEFFNEHFGVCIAYGVPLETVRVLIDGSQREYVDTLPLHHSQRRVEDGDGYSIYEFRLHPTIDFFRAILAMGAEAEVLAPQDFRELLAEETEIMAEIYYKEEGS
ncbi:MAG: WYL domain-containing protein [Bacteroidales bacterium]|nr:WYL domain-containing protein [Bacteroidales bacterium]